jgi:hypothetical protein
MPRPIEARLRADAATQQCTMTDILLAALTFAWEHAGDGEELAQARQALRKAGQKYTALEKRYEARRVQAKADKKARAQLEEERDHAKAMAAFAAERLAILGAANPDLAHANAEAYARVEEASWHRRMAAMREAYARALDPSGQGGEKMVSLRELAKLAHPDKWHGKPAIELGDELMKWANR